MSLIPLSRLTLNLGLDAQLVCALFDALLLKEAAPHLGLVVRSDVAVAPLIVATWKKILPILPRTRARRN